MTCEAMGVGNACQKLPVDVVDRSDFSCYFVYRLSYKNTVGAFYRILIGC